MTGEVVIKLNFPNWYPFVKRTSQSWIQTSATSFKKLVKLLVKRKF